MPLGLKTPNSGIPKASNLHTTIRALIAVVAVAGLVAISIVATSVQNEEEVLGQSQSNRCAEPPVEPRDVHLWEHDSGILVQWETCPEHNYEIRWRLAGETPADPFNWPTQRQIGQADEFDITSLSNGRRYVVQLRPIEVSNNRIDRGRWTDDYFATPQRCGDLPEIPSRIDISEGDGQLTVSWDHCSGSRSHIRWQSADNRGTDHWSRPVDVGTNESFVIEDLENGVEYAVQLRSSPTSGSRVRTPSGSTYTTDWSESVEATPTSTCPAGPPVEPDEFVIVAGDEKLFASWRPCPDHTYQVRYRQRDSNNWSSWRNAAADNYTIRNLNNNTPYEVEVQSQRGGSTVIAGSYVARPISPAQNNRSPRWVTTASSVEIVENRRYDNPIATFKATDADRDDDIRYEIVPPFPALDLFPFSINARDGDIYMYGELDYEVIEEYRFTVRATDVGGFEITHDFDVEVIDAEGPPPPILTRVCSGETGIEVRWRRDNTKYDYELERRTLRSSVGEPTWIGTPIDTELNLPIDTTWVFRVRAVDKKTGEQSKWSSEEAVFVGGARNTAPEFRRELFEYEVLEEQPAGVHVGYAVARDEDRYSSLRYQIIESTPEDAPFEIDDFTGIVTTSGRLDFETQTSYSLVFSATDLCGSSDYADATVTVLDNPDVDAIPLVPNPPTIIERHDQVVVVWPTDYEDIYDLDWRPIAQEYRPRPQDRDATMPTVVDLLQPDTAYAFRLRRVNPLGVAGDWSEETIVDPAVPAPTIAAIDIPRQGQVLGGAEVFLDGITLREGQTARLGFNMFGIDGQLDNSLLDRDDITATWRVAAGDVSNDRDRVMFYTAPPQEGEYDISVVVKQRVPGGIVQRNLEMVVHVIGDNGLVKPYVSDESAPRVVVVDGVEYATIAYSEDKEYRPPQATKALFKVRQHSIPGFEWVGVNIAPGEPAATVEDQIPGFTGVGNVFAAEFIDKTGRPIVNMSFTKNAALCLPVPEEWTFALQALDVTRIAPDGSHSALALPVRFQPDPTFNDPALVCGHSELFDGELFLAISNDAIPTATPTPIIVQPPTATPTPTPEPSPTATATLTPTPSPVPSPTVGISVSTPTPVPTEPPAPTDTPQPPTATSTPQPTATPTSTATPTLEPTSTATPTAQPTEVPILEATDTPVPTATNTPTPAPVIVKAVVPTATSTPTNTPTPVPSNTPTPTAIPPTDTPTVEAVEEVVATVPEEEDRGTGRGGLIFFAVLAFLVIATVVVAFTILNRRPRQGDTSPANPTDPENAPDPAETDLDDPDVAAEEAEDDDEEYERLRIDS